MKIKTIFIILLFFTQHTLCTIHNVHFEDIPNWQVSLLSKYIGDTVIFDQPMYICSNHHRNYTIALRRIFAPTNLFQPNSNQYTAYSKLNASATMTLTGVSEYHRTGEKIYNLKAIINSTTLLQFLDGKWTENTRSDLQKGIDMTKIDKKGKHRLLVCAMNLEYYLTDNLTNDGFGPSDEEEHLRQRTKISSALATINADIYGLAEVQLGQNALAEIANDLYNNTGRNFSYISDLSSVNSSYTKVGYVYCTDVVSPYGKLINNDAQVNNRKKIQAFKENSTNEIFLFSMNHFKAKAGTGSGLDADQGDGQGNFNNTRKKESESVISQYAIYRRQFSDNDILIMGDLNAYAMEDPISVFKDNNMTDLHQYFLGDSSYSYMYAGQAGYLDHALCNSTLLPQITGLYAYHINSDESTEWEYKNNTDETMFRCSDHDPIIVGLNLNKNATPIPQIPFSSPHLVINPNNIEIQYFDNSFHDAHCWLYTCDGQRINHTHVTFENGRFSLPKPSISGLYVLVIRDNQQTNTLKIFVK